MTKSPTVPPTAAPMITALLTDVDKLFLQESGSIGVNTSETKTRSPFVVGSNRREYPFSQSFHDCPANSTGATRPEQEVYSRTVPFCGVAGSADVSTNMGIVDDRQSDTFRDGTEPVGEITIVIPPRATDPFTDPIMVVFRLIVIEVPFKVRDPSMTHRSELQIGRYEFEAGSHTNALGGYGGGRVHPLLPPNVGALAPIGPLTVTGPLSGAVVGQKIDKRFRYARLPDKSDEL
jgi:hypothetical protein